MSYAEGDSSVIENEGVKYPRHAVYAQERTSIEKEKKRRAPDRGRAVNIKKTTDQREKTAR